MVILLTGFIEELKKDDSYYSEYKDNVLILVGVYVFRHEYENAIHWIDSLDEDRLLKEAPKDREPWLSLVNYYSLKMEICRWTDDHEQAETLLEKGKKYLVSYEVDRGHFLQADWTAALKIEEIK